MIDPQMLMALLSASGSMMQAGAPSTNPASGNFMGVLGAGLQGGAKGYMAGDEMRRSQDYLKAMQQAMALKAAAAKPEDLPETMAKFDPRYREDDPNSLAGQFPAWFNRLYGMR